MIIATIVRVREHNIRMVSNKAQTTSISILKALILSKVHYIIYKCRKVMCYIIRLITYYYIIIKLHQS